MEWQVWLLWRCLLLQLLLGPPPGCLLCYSTRTGLEGSSQPASVSAGEESCLLPGRFPVSRVQPKRLTRPVFSDSLSDFSAALETFLPGTQTARARAQPFAPSMAPPPSSTRSFATLERRERGVRCHVTFSRCQSTGAALLCLGRPTGFASAEPILKTGICFTPTLRVFPPSNFSLLGF